MATLTPQSPPAGGALPAARANGNPNSPAGLLGELIVSESAPQYYNLIKSGFVFSLSSLTTTSLTAFTGGAAGTPLLGLYNPVSSGKDLVILQARLGVRTTGTTAGTVDFNFFQANQGGVTVTGTQTQSRNMYSQASTGSVAYGMVNTANTGAVASTLVAPSFSLGNVTTTAGLNAALFVDDIKGALIVSPGTYLAFGSAATLAVASLDASLIWAELPV